MASHLAFWPKLEKPTFCEKPIISGGKPGFSARKTCCFLFIKKATVFWWENWVFAEIQKIRFFCWNRSFFLTNSKILGFSPENYVLLKKPSKLVRKPDFSGRDQKFLLQILKYRKTRFFWFRFSEFRNTGFFLISVQKSLVFLKSGKLGFLNRNQKLRFLWNLRKTRYFSSE